jgi:hypothetical protein
MKQYEQLASDWEVDNAGSLLDPGDAPVVIAAYEAAFLVARQMALDLIDADAIPHTAAAILKMGEDEA